MSTAPHADASLKTRSLPSAYGQYVLAAHALVGAVAWGSQLAVEPLAVAVVVSTILGIWTSFRQESDTSWRLMLALCVSSILIVGLMFREGRLPDWLLDGPWCIVVQAIVVGTLILMAARPKAERSSNTTHVLGAGQLSANPSRIVDFADEASGSPESGRPDRTIAKRCVGAVAIVLVGYLVAYPVAEKLLAGDELPKSGAAVEDMTFGESIRLRTVKVFAGIWAFAFGACVGSFVNVLVYRQPRGESVLTQPSACPSCNQKIESKDNIPVVGWLMLGGRCRTCQVPISARYPIVEAVAGGIFAILVFAELTSGGANLPIRRPNTYTGFVWTIFYPKWDLISLTLYHFHMFMMLLTWMLMTIDRAVIPTRSMVAAWLIAIACPLAWNRLWIMPPGFVGSMVYTQEPLVIASAMGAGAVTGLLMAGVAYLCRCGPWRPLVAGLVLVGLTLGWQAVTTVGVIAVASYVFATLVSRRSVSFMGVLITVAFVHHLAWRAIVAGYSGIVETLS